MKLPAYLHWNTQGVLIVSCLQIAIYNYTLLTNCKLQIAYNLQTAYKLQVTTCFKHIATTIPHCCLHHPIAYKLQLTNLFYTIAPWVSTCSQLGFKVAAHSGLSLQSPALEIAEVCSIRVQACKCKPKLLTNCLQITIYKLHTPYKLLTTYELPPALNILPQHFRIVVYPPEKAMLKITNYKSIATSRCLQLTAYLPATTYKLASTYAVFSH